MKKFLLVASIFLLASYAFAADSCTSVSLDSGLEPYTHPSSYFKSDNFHFYVAVPTNFVQSNFSFVNAADNCAGNGQWTAATVPTGGEALLSCYTLLQKTISWQNLYEKCGSIRSTTDSLIKFRFQIRIDGVQSFTADDGGEDQSLEVTRTMTNQIPFIVTFPKSISVVSNSTDVTNTLSDGRVPGQAILTNIFVNSTGVVLDTTLLLELTTLVTYPDYLATPSTLSSPTNTTLIPQAQPIASDCESIKGKLCQQQWRFYVSLNDYRCDFNGKYQIRFTYQCQSIYQGNCPHSHMDVSVGVNTVSHCPTVTTADLTGSLTTYSDKDFTQAASNFKLRSVVYADFIAHSDTASISSATLRQITLSQPGYDDVTMLTWGTVSTNGTKAFCKVTNSDSITIDTDDSFTKRARFSCRLDPTHIILPSLASRAITWKALVEVVFSSTSDSTASANTATAVRRRLLTLEMTQPTEADSTVAPSSRHNAPMTTEASTVNRVVSTDIDLDDEDQDEDSEDVNADSSSDYKSTVAAVPSSASAVSISLSAVCAAVILSMLRFF